MAKKYFYVYPNPFIAVDHDGYPQGACPCDMAEHVGMTVRKFVAAELDRENTKILEKLSEEVRRYRDPRQQTRFAFDFSAPTMLPVTEYYKDRLRHREIIAADEFTARCGDQLEDGVFVDPKDALQLEKEKAIADWKAHGHQDQPEHIDVHDAAIAKVVSKESE